MNSHLTEVIFIIDRSGSMAGLETETIDGINSIIAKKREGEVLLTLVLFDDKYELVWNGIDAKDAKLTEKEYYVRGMTALLDAVGKTILDVGHRLAETPENERPGKVICVITTDGMENASHEFTYHKVREMIKHQEEKYNWEFIFMGANIEVGKEADQLGIKQENAVCFEASSKGVKRLYEEQIMELIENE